MIAKVLRWGNSYGLRLTKDDVEREGLREGQEVVVEIKAKPAKRIDLSHLSELNLGGDLSVRHDEVEWA